jgi:amino acid permease
LQQLLITCAAVSWAVICATYLRFHRIVQIQGMRGAIPPKALSPLQPYLAYYGLAWSILFGSQPSMLSSLTIVIFNGYEVFTRHNELWSQVSISWGPFVSSWVELGVLFLIFFGWLLHGYVVFGHWSLRIPNLEDADIINGVALPLEDENDERGWPKKSISWILNNV